VILAAAALGSLLTRRSFRELASAFDQISTRERSMITAMSGLLRSTLVCSAAYFTFTFCALASVFLYLRCDSGLPLGHLGGGTTMDSSALQELIAQVRGTTAALAEAERRVASFTAELAHQDRGPQPDAKPAQPIPTPIAKHRSSGWVPAG
jgi:hypothetical protein